MDFVRSHTFFITPILIFTIVFSFFAFIPTKKAEAQLTCIWGIGGLIPGTEVPVNDSTQNSKTCTLDTIAFTIAKTVLNSLINSITDWARNGFPNGGPSFAKNLKQTMQNFADGEIAGFLSELAGVNICSPAYLNFAFQVGGAQRTRGSQYQCTLTQAIANVQAFQQDFESGGWIGYQQALGDQNNPLGFAINSSVGVNNRIARTQGNAQQELSWGRGFFSYKDANGNTLTPGSAIESSLQNSLGSSVRQLELADSINELVSAILSTLTQQAFQSARGLFN